MTRHSGRHVIHRTHAIQVGKIDGRFLGVCLECGKLLGIAKRLRLLVLLEKFHTCPQTLFGNTHASTRV
jgi:hypothetical protein